MPSARPIDKPFVSDDRVIAFDPWIVVAFLFPLTKLFTINLGGTLFGQDVLGLALFLFFIVQKDGVARLNQISSVLGLILVWLLGQVMTDLYRGTPIEDYSRGWLKIVMFGFQIATLWLFLSRRSQYLVAFILGHGISLVGTLPALQEAYGDQFWKFGFGDGIGMIVAVVFSGMLPLTQSLRRYAWVAIAITAFFLLSVNFRSGFGIFLIAAGICFVLRTFERLPQLRQSFNGRVFAVMLLGGVAFSQGIFGIYGYFAGNGALGKEAEYKYKIQSRGDVSILLGGRVESLVSIQAVADSPILGHGSWARDLYYARMLQKKVQELGIAISNNRKLRHDLIPSHSYLMGAWVEAGILGALFWAYTFFVLIGTIYGLLKYNVPGYAALLVPLLVTMWAIPFSPFGAEARFSAGLAIVIAMIIRRATAAHDARLAATRTAIAGHA